MKLLERYYMKSIVLFLVGLMQIDVIAMVNECCDYKGLESTARRYALTILDKKEINPDGIERDLQFFSQNIFNQSEFRKYLAEDAFGLICNQAINENQKKIVEIFSSKFDMFKKNDLLRAQFCALLERVVDKLSSPIRINVKTHPFLKNLTTNPSFTLQKLLLPTFVGEPIDS